MHNREVHLHPPQKPAGGIAIVVLGMHRSGTSAVSGALAKLGAALPASLMGASTSNVEGHFESWAVASLNDHLLVLNGSSWDDPFPLLQSPLDWRDEGGVLFVSRATDVIAAEFGDAARIVLKDPRLCVLFPVWQIALKTLGRQIAVVIPFRRPDEVAASLSARNGMAPNLARLLWLKHVVLAERASRGLQRVFSSYDALVEQPAEALLRVQGALQPSLENVATGEGAAFIKSAHRHWSRADTFEHFPAVSQLKAVYAACLEAETTGLAPQDAFDSAHRFLMDFSALARPIFEVSQRNATEARSLALTVARERTRVEALASRFETLPSGGLRGGLDELVEGRAVGWAMQDIAPDVRLSISLRRGDEIVSEGIANTFRPDLLAAGHGDGAYGFEILFDGPAEGVLAFASSARESWVLSLRHSARETAPPGSGLVQ